MGILSYLLNISIVRVQSPFTGTQYEKLYIGVLQLSRSEPDNIVLIKNTRDMFCIHNIVEPVEKEIIIIGQIFLEPRAFFEHPTNSQLLETVVIRKLAFKDR